jgi:hypothetical protein
MARIEKLFDKIRNNPKNVRFEDACKAAEAIGFVHKSQNGTSHAAFSRPGEPMALNFQSRDNGKIPPYQAKQLIVMLEKYGDE